MAGYQDPIGGNLREGENKAYFDMLGIPNQREPEPNFWQRQDKFAIESQTLFRADTASVPPLIGYDRYLTINFNAHFPKNEPAFGRKLAVLNLPQ